MHRIGIATFEAILCSFTALMWMFLYCCFAAQIIAKLAEIANIAYLSHWYNYPNCKLRKFRILVICRSSVPFEFSGLNIFYCNLETFGKVKWTARKGHIKAIPAFWLKFWFTFRYYKRFHLITWCFEISIEIKFWWMKLKKIEFKINVT